MDFDINPARVVELRSGHNTTLETEPHELQAAKHLRFSTNTEDLHTFNRFVVAAANGAPIFINGDGDGDGEISRDNAAVSEVYNVAAVDRTTRNELYAHLQSLLLPHCPHLQNTKLIYRNFRTGDVRHSLADISKAAARLSYVPAQRLRQELKLAIPWYAKILVADFINADCGSTSRLNR